MSGLSGRRNADDLADVHHLANVKVAGDLEYLLRRYGQIISHADRVRFRCALALLQGPVDKAEPTAHNATTALRPRKVG